MFHLARQEDVGGVGVSLKHYIKKKIRQFHASANLQPKKVLGIHYEGGYSNIHATRKCCGKEKYFSTLPGIKPDSSVVKPAA
jgi:hypothetical protein